MSEKVSFLFDLPSSKYSTLARFTLTPVSLFFQWKAFVTGDVAALYAVKPDGTAFSTEYHLAHFLTTKSLGLASPLYDAIFTARKSGATAFLGTDGKKKYFSQYQYYETRHGKLIKKEDGTEDEKPFLKINIQQDPQAFFDTVETALAFYWKRLQNSSTASYNSTEWKNFCQKAFLDAWSGVSATHLVSFLEERGRLPSQDEVCALAQVLGPVDRLHQKLDQLRWLQENKPNSLFTGRRVRVELTEKDPIVLCVPVSIVHVDGHLCKIQYKDPRTSVLTTWDGVPKSLLYHNGSNGIKFMYDFHPSEPSDGLDGKKFMYDFDITLDPGDTRSVEAVVMAVGDDDGEETKVMVYCKHGLLVRSVLACHVKRHQIHLEDWNPFESVQILGSEFILVKLEEVRTVQYLCSAFPGTVSTSSSLNSPAYCLLFPTGITASTGSTGSTASLCGGVCALPTLLRAIGCGSGSRRW